jgi:hypothetical protein
MSNERETTHASGQALRAVIRNAAGRVWRAVTPAFAVLSIVCELPL